ncbi:amidase [Castellaniella sp.]|uniref:amidase n=1 Tax=Castellaniella sp. TaxID=1955812 RepID=UPI003A93B4C6
MSSDRTDISPEVLSLCELADAAQHTVSARTLVETSLKAIKEASDFNGFVRVHEDQALVRVQHLDQLKRDGNPCGPLHGVPLAHKDMFFQAGELAECGSRILAGCRPNHTATVLQRLEQAGAVNLGALHMAEFAMSPTGFNAHLGHGRNPWSNAHVSGGSSSGSGAAVGGRFVAGALGSDTGGSVRIPAAACGVTGLKPTQHAVSTYGVMPLSPSLDCVGFLAQTARDCARLLSVVSGPDSLDPACLASRPQNYESGLERPLTTADVICVPHFSSNAPLTDEVRALVEQAEEDLAKAGATIRRVALPDFSEAGSLATLVLGVEAASIHGQWLSKRPDDYGNQVRRRIQRGCLYPATRYADALRLRTQYQARFLREYLDDGCALLLPVLPCAVPTIQETIIGSEQDIEARFGNFSYWTRGINYLGLPGLALPAGVTTNGLPNGIQLVGRPFSEAILLRLGHQYQRHTQWHRRHPRMK